MDSEELHELLSVYGMNAKELAYLMRIYEHTVRFYLSGTLPIPFKRALAIQQALERYRLGLPRLQRKRRANKP